MSSSIMVAADQCHALVEDTDSQDRSEFKRRKVRKGTHSCWECKRRKMKCIFENPTNTICKGCRRRGSRCISQEFPEDVSLTLHTIDDSTVRVESQIDRLAERAGSNSTTPYGRTPSSPVEDDRRTDHGIPTPMSMNSGHPQDLDFYKSYKVGVRELNYPLMRID